MSAQIADFQLKFSTDSAQFNKDVEYAKKMLRGYTTEASAANDENLGLIHSLKESAAKANLLAAGFVTAAAGVTAVATASAAAMIYMIKSQANVATELERMSTVSQETVEEIQALSYASEQYNISGEKMSDILKDVNDKLGDYAQTGGGEFADFFDNILPKVGLTTDALQKMSGSDALVAVKNAMDEANVPMKDQIFYLESIANDASALMPLLENQGKKLYELKEHYNNLNIAMSQFDIDSLKLMNKEITDIELQLNKVFNSLSTQVAYTLLPSIQSVNSQLSLLTEGVKDYRTQIQALGVAHATLNVFMGKSSKEYHAELFADYRAAKEEVDKYAGEDINKLPSINPFGLSKNGWRNAQVEYTLAKNKLKEFNDSIVAEQKRINALFDPLSTTPTGTTGEFDYGDNTKYDDKKLASLDIQLASETEKLRLAHEQRLADIEAYNISAAELKSRGFDSLAELIEAYSAKENTYYQQQMDDYYSEQEARIQAELEAYQSAEDKKTAIVIAANKKRAEEDKKTKETQLTGFTSYMSQLATLQNSENKRAAAVGRAAARINIMINTYEMATKAYNSMVGIPSVGPVLAAAAAATAVGFGMAQYNAVGMAHNGIAEIPDEGTWLLDKGERVYTNDSAVKLDKMYSAIMSMYSNIYGTTTAANYSSYSSTSTVSSGSANVIVNLIEDASRAGTVDQSTDGDITTLDIKVAKLLNSASSQTASVMKSRYRNQQYGT